ncbi:hypothetical protein FOL46_005526, partial [Perkinsus olseni]
SVCDSAQERCRNCCDYNEAQARAGRPHRRETNHQATSPGCPSVEAHCRRMAARTNYGPAPEFPKQFSPTTYSYHGNKEGTAILLKNGLSGTTLVAARDFCIVK